MVILAALLLIYLLFSIKYPDFMFWLAVTIFLDPGGYIFTYVDRSIIGGMQITDINFVLLMLPLISPKINIKLFFRCKDNRWILYFLLFFAVIYHIIIFGFIAPGFKWQSLLQVLQYQRLAIWGFLVIIPTYIFFRRSYQLMLKFAFVTSIIIVILYLVRLSTGIPAIPFWIHERGLGIDATRVSLYSYGFAYWFIYISLVSYLFKLNLPKKNWIYFIGIMIAVAQFIALTRRSTLLLVYSSFIVYLLYTRILNHSVISLKMGRMMVILGIPILTLYLIAPNYINYSKAIIENVFVVVNQNTEDPELKDDRFEHNMPGHLARFRQSPIIGYGYDMLWYSNVTKEGGLSANDVPLTAALGMFGVLGLSIFSVYYFRIFKILFQSYNILRYYYRNYLARQNTILFCILMAFLVAFISAYTLNYMGYFSDLIVGKSRVLSMLNIGVLIASRDILAQKIMNYNLNLNIEQ